MGRRRPSESAQGHNPPFEGGDPPWNGSPVTPNHGNNQSPDRLRLRLDKYTRWVYSSLPMIQRVEITRRAEKQLRKLPRHIVDNLAIWVAAVEFDGLEEVRRLPGYHDEPLKGDRAGQRSIRLSRSYRAIYEIRKDTARFVSVEEVSKHDY